MSEHRVINMIEESGKLLVFDLPVSSEEVKELRLQAIRQKGLPRLPLGECHLVRVCRVETSTKWEVYYRFPGGEMVKTEGKKTYDE